MIKKTITVTEQQNDWIKAQMTSGSYGNESEVIRDLIRHRQAVEHEGPEEIAYIRQLLEEGESSGFTDKSVDEIWATAARNVKGPNAPL